MSDDRIDKPLFISDEALQKYADETDRVQFANKRAVDTIKHLQQYVDQSERDREELLGKLADAIKRAEYAENLLREDDGQSPLEWINSQAIRALMGDIRRIDDRLDVLESHDAENDEPREGS